MVKLACGCHPGRRSFLRASAALAGLAFGGCAVPPTRRSASLPAREEFVVRGATILTMDPALGDLAGDIHVRDGVIVAIGPRLDLSGVATVDGSGTIAMPGFVETHWHLWNSVLRPLVKADDAKEGYFPVTLRLGPLCSPLDAYRSVRLSVAEALASGITTLHDWSHNVRTPEHADAELRALQETGVRARFSYGWGQDLRLGQAMNLDDLARVKRAWLPNDGRISLGAAVRTPVANPRGIVPIEVLERECEGIRKLGLPITMHARPGIVSLLEKHGLLGPDLQLVHPQGLAPDELKLVAARGTSFSTAPIIEMHYAQATRGVIQFAELEQAAVRQSLSIDSSAASANADFFACMRALLLAHKQRFGTKVPLPPRRLLQLATIDGARDLGLADRIGSLTPGKRADLILVRTTDVNMAPVGDPAYALVYSAQPANVDTVVVDGRILRRAGRFAALDVDEIVREAGQTLRELRSRV